MMKRKQLSNVFVWDIVACGNQGLSPESQCSTHPYTIYYAPPEYFTCIKYQYR